MYICTIYKAQFSQHIISLVHYALHIAIFAVLGQSMKTHIVQYFIIPFINGFGRSQHQNCYIEAPTMNVRHMSMYRVRLSTYMYTCCLTCSPKEHSGSSSSRLQEAKARRQMYSVSCEILDISRCYITIVWLNYHGCPRQHTIASTLYSDNTCILIHRHWILWTRSSLNC